MSEIDDGGPAEAPQAKQFRDVGFTEHAAAFPRDDLALVMLAAFNNVTVEQLAPGMRFFPNESTMAAWGRVADAARAALSRAEGGDRDQVA